MSIWRWAERFSQTPEKYRVTLGEGRTPLVRSRRIGPSLGVPSLYFKLESSNPTGSYKDRFGAAAISDMLANGKRRCIATSSGNTGAALAAYCAVAGMECLIAVIDSVPAGKLKQMMAYGANVVRIRGFGVNDVDTQRGFERLDELSAAEDAQLQVSAFKYSLAGMLGVKTISYELAEDLGADIDHVFSPAGGCGLTLAVARGFDDLLALGEIDRGPRIECVQPAGCNTTAGALRDGRSEAQPVECTTTISGLQVPCVIDGNEMIVACRSSRGTGHVVDDEPIHAAQKRLALEEGIFCEPAGATAFAGALDAIGSGMVDRDAVVVCLVTGSGFKDEPSVDRMLEGCESPVVTVDEFQQWE